VDDETGDDMSKPNRPTFDANMTAFLRTISGTNKSASTIAAYRTRTDEELWVVTKWDRSFEIVRCQRSSPTGSTVATTYGISSPEIDFSSSACCS
jgi:hypothetical protein